MFEYLLLVLSRGFHVECVADFFLPARLDFSFDSLGLENLVLLKNGGPQKFISGFNQVLNLAESFYEEYATPL